MKIKMALCYYLVAHASLLIGADYASAQEIVQYVHTDALGSPVAISDAAGAIIERTTYGPYGAAMDSPSGDRPGYAGHMSDASTDLAYMQQRYYDPAVARFLSVDPVGADLSTGENFNRYTYALNNPYRYFDPDGRLPDEKKDPPPPPTDMPTVTAIAPAMNMPVTTTLPSVTATRPISMPPIPWPAVGEFIVSRAAVPLMLLWPTEMGASPCELPGGPPCGAGVMYSKGKQNQRDSGLRDLSDEEVNARARDSRLSNSEKKRYIKEGKARGLRNKNKRNENY
ncbi:RHS repeat domain-containing protein [Stenotrophomonas rhizophila]